MNHSKPSPPGVHGGGAASISSSNQHHPKQRRATTTTIEHRPLGQPLRNNSGDIVEQQQQQQTTRHPPTRRRASQDNAGRGIVSSFVATRQNSIKFRHDEPAWYDDSSCSGIDSIMSSVAGGLEVMDLRPSAATLQQMRASATSSLASLSSSGVSSSGSSSGSNGNSAMSAPAVSKAGYLEPKFSRFFQVTSSKSKGRSYKKKNSWLPKQWKEKEDSSLSSQGSEEEGEGAISSSQASPSAAVMSLLRSSFSLGNKNTKTVTPLRPQRRRGSFDGNFSSEESDSNVSSNSSSNSSRVSLSDTSSKLWDRMEMSHHSMMSLTAMLDVSDGNRNVRGRRCVSNRGVFSRRGCARMMVTVVGAVALATLVYIVLEEDNSKLMLDAMTNRSAGLFEKLFGNRHGSIDAAGQEDTTKDTNQLRHRKLPREGNDGVPEMEMTPKVFPEDQANDVFYYMDDISTPEASIASPDNMSSLELETKQAVDNISSSEAMQVIPPVPAQVNKRVTIPTPTKPVQHHKSKNSSGMTAHERNRKEHLERLKDY